MLVDALVFGVYKRVSILLHVSVLPLLELDFKRVYFIQMGRLGTRDECFETTSGRCCCYFQVPFLTVKWRKGLNQSKPKPCGCFGTSIRDECSKKLHKSVWKTVFCYTENAKWISKSTLRHPTFRRRSCQFNIPWVKVTVVGSVGSLNRSIRVFFNNHRLGMYGFIAGEGADS